MQTQFQVGSYIHACTNEAHSLTNLEDLIPTLAGISTDKEHKPAKVGIESYRLTRECVSFVYAWMYLPRWNYVCMNRHK